VLQWPEKGDGVAASVPKLPGNIVFGESQPIQGSGKLHGLVWDYKTLLKVDS
jgi:hypothetical protein